MPRRRLIGCRIAVMPRTEVLTTLRIRLLDGHIRIAEANDDNLASRKGSEKKLLLYKFSKNFLLSKVYRRRKILQKGIMKEGGRNTQILLFQNTCCTRSCADLLPLKRRFWNPKIAQKWELGLKMISRLKQYSRNV